MKKRLLIAFILLFLFTTFNAQQNLNFKINSKINEIIIENNLIINESEIKKDLSFLYSKNLFFIKNSDINKNLSQSSFIESFEIKKIYPSKLKIKIYEKKPIAILQNKMRKYYYTDKGDTIDFIDLKEFENLPLVFGDELNFKKFHSSLKKINFPINTVKSFYFFETKRWDLTTKQNQTIKLPPKNFEKSLKNFMSIKNEENFIQYKTFDYRIKEQLIIK